MGQAHMAPTTGRPHPPSPCEVRRVPGGVCAQRGHSAHMTE